jgi:ABC-type lipoprotein release transport system permease subunit
LGFAAPPTSRTVCTTLESMLNDVTPTDPAVFFGNAAMVLLVSMAACYVPARWAGRVDPAMVLRND